ncbi:hypothetical protein KR093_009159 [Drosophila rubida]|uniref:Uncharacterized protein n=1 Tax=Drosophila rubida TaxID=30044 RepID=A0AAD4KCF6_9MUSC|nr:hypothetical protein KR093_009159 [Drosophila rubida]
MSKVCAIPQSPQQLIYTLYKDIAMAELMAYILNEYSLMIRHVSNQDNFSVEINNIRNNYENITENALDSLIKALRLATRGVWHCDPEKHIYKVTYDEVTRLLQGYVENEVNLNNEDSCSKTCPDYQNTTRTGCFEDEFCSKQPQCSGKIYDCQFFDSDVSVCQSPVNSNRRYEYIEYSNGNTLGEYNGCWRDVDKVESWNRWIFTKCSYCFCLCDELGPKSDRYFNLRETISDVKANKVVTGVRFIKKNRVFHIQIQQGQLLPRGAINESTLDWIPVDDYKINDTTVMDGVDYHTLTYTSRSLDLTEIKKSDDPSFVVTGVRLGSWFGLNLEVHFSKFDFVKGELVEPEVNGVWETNNIYARERVNPDNADLPTRAKKKLFETLVPKSDQYNQFVEFVNTGVDKDAAQATVPFIDIREVVSIPPVPLGGIGLSYKGKEGYGGFVLPEIINYDILPYIPVPKTPSK